MATNFTPNNFTPLKVTSAQNAAAINLPKNYVPQMSYNTPVNTGAALYGNFKPTPLTPQVKALQNAVTTPTLQNTVKASVVQPAASNPYANTFQVQPVQNTASILQSTAKPVATLAQTTPTAVQPIQTPTQQTATSAGVSSSQISPTTNYTSTNEQLNAVKNLLALSGSSGSGSGGSSSSGGGSSGIGSGFGSFTGSSYSPDYTSLNAISSEYEKTLTPSDSEKQLQEQINALNASMNAGILDTEGQTIPMPFITGQQATIEKSGLNKINTLKDQLALFQANRTAQQDVLKQRLTTEAAKVQADIDANKPVSVGGALVNAKTGQVLYNTPEKTATPIEVGNALVDPTSGKVIYQGKEDTYGGVLAKLPTSIQNRVISQANNFGSSDIVKRYNAVADGINLINGIPTNTTNPADHQTIVYAFAKSLDPDSVVREGEYATIKKYAQSLLDKFGKEISNAISGTGFLSQNAISNIKSTMNNNFNSRKPAYESLYEQQKNIINSIAGFDVADEIMVDYSKSTTNSQQDTTLDSDLQILRQNFPNYSDDQLMQLRNEARGFSSVGGDTKKATQAIGQYESGGNYRAVGKVTSSGDVAYGKYQIMGANIPNWTREALGYSMTPQQFLNNATAQDKVAEYKINQYMQKYGNIQDVATAWFAGEGAVGKNYQGKDVVGTSVPQYVKNIVSIYNNLA